MDQLDVTTVAHRALWESIASTLRRAIVLGQLPPGTRLEEPPLAVRFGVSRLPVREAIAKLSHEGLVKSEPRRGAYVVGFGEEDVRDAFDVRLLLEREAVRRAAKRITPDGAARLRKLVGEMEQARRSDRLPQVTPPDVSFHREIVVLSGSKHLLAAWEPLDAILTTMLSITNNMYPDMKHAVQSHLVILEALEAGDGGAAEALLVTHITNTANVMCDALARARATVMEVAGQ